MLHGSSGVPRRPSSSSSRPSRVIPYTGELLPEDRYDDWSAERRNFLADLYVRLLLGLADALEKRGAHSEVRDRLRQVIQQDPTREDVHRRLMRLYAEMGSRHEAVRQ